MVKTDEQVGLYIPNEVRYLFSKYFSFIQIDVDALRTACSSCLASFLIGQQLLVCIKAYKQESIDFYFIR